MASIQAMLSTPGNAPAAPAPSHLADSHDSGFHAVLTSYASAAQPAHDIASRGTHADKPGKAVDRVRPSSDAKVSGKEERAEEKAAKKSENKSDKVSENSQVVAAIEPVRAPAPVHVVAAPQPAANDDSTDSEDAQAVERAPAQLAASPKIAAASQTKARPSLKNIPDASAKAPADPQTEAALALANERSVTADRQTAPVKEVSKQAMAEIIAAAKGENQKPVSTTQQFAANTAQQTTARLPAASTTQQPAAQQPAPSSSPRIVQALTANVAAMLNAVRGTITVSSPKAAMLPESDVKPATAPTDKAAQPAAAPQPQQSFATGKSAQNSQNDARDASRDQNRPVSDDVVKTDVAVVDQATPNPAPATSAPQPAPPTAQIAVAAMPNAVNTAASAQTSAAPHPLPGGAQSETAPNIPALATAIAAKSAAGTKTFDIRMDPPELGRVDVHLSVDRDGKVQAMLSAEHPQTLELLQRDSHNLERALKDAGLDLSNNSLNFSLKGEGRQGDGGGASTARARIMPNAVVARAEAANALHSNFNYASGDGRLDIRV